jgi:hypothetical protein
MSRATDFTRVFAPATRRTGLTSAPLPIITLLLTPGSLPLPLSTMSTG